MKKCTSATITEYSQYRVEWIDISFYSRIKNILRTKELKWWNEKSIFDGQNCMG